MGFSRQEYWRGLPFPFSGDLCNPEIEPRSPALQADSLSSEPPGSLSTPVCLVAQSCLTLCYCMDSSPPGSFVHGDSPGKNTGVGSHSLLLDLPNPEIEPRSPALHADSLPTESPGKPLGKHTKKSRTFSDSCAGFSRCSCYIPSRAGIFCLQV